MPDAAAAAAAAVAAAFAVTTLAVTSPLTRALCLAPCRWALSCCSEVTLALQGSHTNTRGPEGPPAEAPLRTWAGLIAIPGGGCLCQRPVAGL
uniref:Putative secreted protein n=1 Tax=Ixodes ricinus TaxID=34613 RepID=A0A6B0U872_IXORI